MRKKRIIAVLCAFVMAIAPIGAVFKEDNLNHTLSVLLMELKETYSGLIQFSGSAEKRIKEQHQKLVELINECNELSVMLYSQASENTFDLTFALNEVTKQYEGFKNNDTPYAEVKANLTTEMERYNRLVLTLRKMPPERTAEEIKQDARVAVALDSVSNALAQADTAILSTPDFAIQEFDMKMDDATIAVRDSCLYVAEQIVAYYWQQIQQIDKDQEYYDQTDERLRGAYTYAQERYETVQQKVFVQGQSNYFKTLGRFSRRFTRAMADFRSRYSLNVNRSEEDVVSSWRGPVVYFYSFMLLLVLAVAIWIATIIVNWGVKRTRMGKTEWFNNHKGMIIALLGVFLFGVFLFFNAKASNNTFIVRSSKMMGEFAWLIAAIFLSMLIRLDRSQIKNTLISYIPTLVMAFIVVYFRIIFIPNSVINLLFPPLLLLATISQFWVNSKKYPNEDRGDVILLWISAIVMTLATIISWIGLVMAALLILIWWFFQLSLLETLIAISELLNRYYDSHVKKKMAEYRLKNPNMPLSSSIKGSYIRVTWLDDLLKMTLMPLLQLWSFPAAVFMACNVFNFTKVAEKFFFTHFIQAGSEASGGGITMSLFLILLIVSLFFLFRYLVYVGKAGYRAWKTKEAVRKLGENVLFKETDINFNLANNIISLLLWGIYIIIVFLMLKIPASGLALITTGLATGMGFAMKDILNNFFYGIQLMGGRVRVGDVVECDGIRGNVVGLSYQTTQIEGVDGSIMFFTNSALFNKNFKNLTRNNSYQIISFLVGIKYGTDVEKARQIIVDALTPLMVRDKYGREVVDKRFGITVRVHDFGDSAIVLNVLVKVTVETYASFPAKAREAVYKAFNENGIEIPFPQQDVYIKEVPEQHA
jgi:small-conductance mechanosensitive channel